MGLQTLKPPTDSLEEAEIERSLRAAVLQFRDRVSDPPREMRIGRAIRLRFQRASQPHSTVLLLGSSSDHDSGGFVVAELVRNLQIYIPEKLTKVAPFRHRYPEWWLAFEDRISYGSLDQEGLEQLRQALGPITGFERVVLVNPLEHARAVQIHPSLNAEA